MRSRRFAPLVVLVALALPATALALPATALAHIRLEGAFTMTGQITSVRGVTGEYVGEPVTRVWLFVAPCPAGQCRIEGLVRTRATGVDRIQLTHKYRVFNHWVGHGSFYAPLVCAGRVYPRGERVLFRITVKITAQTLVSGAPVATAIQARYESYRWTNRTRCITTSAHDAAVYTGQPVTPVPGQSGSTPVPG